MDKIKIKVGEYNKNNEEKLKVKSKAYYESNKEAIKTNVKIYAKSNQEAIKTKNKEYYKNNSEEISAKSKEYYTLNSEKIKARVKIYHDANPEKIKAYARNRIARKHEAAYETFILEDIHSRHGYDCHICEEPISYESSRVIGKPGWRSGLHLDHVVPLSRGGTNLIENVKPSHGFCNVAKNSKLMEELPLLIYRKQEYLKSISKNKV